MKIVFLSVTGHTRKFVDKLDMDSVEISPTNPFFSINEPYLLIVPTYEVDATEPVNDFLETEDNLSFCKGVIGTGNLNFAKLYCFTAKDISRDYGIPLLHMLEFQGNKKDVNKVRKEAGLLDE